MLGPAALVFYPDVRLQRPGLLVGVQKVVGQLGERLAQELIVEDLDGGVLVGEADGAVFIQLVEVPAAVGGEAPPRRGWAGRRRRSSRRGRP